MWLKNFRNMASRSTGKISATRSSRERSSPTWMKEIVAKAAMDNHTWGYCHTRGVLETREFICETTNARGGAQITPDDIIFFNGLGDAIAKIYGCPAGRGPGADAVTLLHHPHPGGDRPRPRRPGPVPAQVRGQLVSGPGGPAQPRQVQPQHLRHHDHQPGQPDRHGLSRRDPARDRRRSPGRTTCSSSPTRSTSTSSTTARRPCISAT